MLSGERLVLREFDSGDLDAVHTYAKDIEVVRYMEWGPNSRAETEEFLARAEAQACADPRANYELAVVELNTGILVGGMGLRTEGLQGLLGYCFARSSWGNGYATEAARLMVAFGFGSLGLHRIRARCDSENAASRRVLEKIGMRREGCFKHDCQIRGEWRNTEVMAILESEWSGSR